MLSSEPSQQCVNFFDIIVIQSVCPTLVRYGIWFYRHCAPPTICCGFFFVFGHRVSLFGGFQCPVNHCSTASYCFGALTRGQECMSFYSTILNQKPLEFWFLHLGIFFFFFAFGLKSVFSQRDIKIIPVTFWKENPFSIECPRQLCWESVFHTYVDLFLASLFCSIYKLTHTFMCVCLCVCIYMYAFMLMICVLITMTL